MYVFRYHSTEHELTRRTHCAADVRHDSWDRLKFQEIADLARTHWSDLWDGVRAVLRYDQDPAKSYEQ